MFGSNWLYLRPACQSFVFYYTVGVLCGSLLFLVALCQHCNKAIIIIIIIIMKNFLREGVQEQALYKHDPRSPCFGLVFSEKPINCARM